MILAPENDSSAFRRRSRHGRLTNPLESKIRILQKWWVIPQTMQHWRCLNISENWKNICSYFFVESSKTFESDLSTQYSIIYILYHWISHNITTIIVRLMCLWWSCCWWWSKTLVGGDFNPTSWDFGFWNHPKKAIGIWQTQLQSITTTIGEWCKPKKWGWLGDYCWVYQVYHIIQ